MKTITIDHPLRTISYQAHDDRYPLNHETQALDNYRLAHDQVWRMKLLFEKEKGEAQLALINLHKLDEERDELNDMFGFYKEHVDFSSKSLHTELEVGFQVELRNFYNSVIEQHRKLVQFYDVIGTRDREYITIADTYCRGEKPIDPLRFEVLDSVFRHHEDMHVDVVSLDKDLQQFLTVLADVYLLLDSYIQQYNILYSTYSDILQKTAQLTKDVQVLETVWGEQ
ncbi:hypothetical protein [Sphingobacterium sp. SGR-19]|uniref:hypothetical protein n=1 Tax=Sphingobacterium sp. SGR-19 TaxID=2710886 RepID=UPI0013EBDDEE|nr:hypothetical protein [Sphingobacterium sp. SGR-19]NGM63787.1 hypothetical protein [Sphingobacterium sp. SGR-19]